MFPSPSFQPTVLVTIPSAVGALPYHSAEPLYRKIFWVHLFPCSWDNHEFFNPFGVLLRGLSQFSTIMDRLSPHLAWPRGDCTMMLTKHYREGVVSWCVNEVRWCSDVMRVERAYPAGINRQTSWWAPPSYPAFLDVFTILFVIKTFEALGICLVFSLYWIICSFAHYSLPEFS